MNMYAEKILTDYLTIKVEYSIKKQPSPLK